MKSVDEVKPVIQNIYRKNVKKKSGKISKVSIKHANVYRVVVETDDKEMLLAEIRQKFIDDYIDFNSEQAKQRIIDALSNFRPLSHIQGI
ncbi:MAG: hypothetical protein L6406_14815 [Desulfobacterales bacterium]|nr:hypothetical protein [Desulfobacterales bacterium]